MTTPSRVNAASRAFVMSSPALLAQYPIAAPDAARLSMPPL